MEILIVIAILAILFTIGLVTMNPAGQFARARNQQRGFHINAVRNAMKQKEADDRLGGFVCQSAGSVPTSTIRMSASGYDIASCLVPYYLQNMPFDPLDDNAFYNSISAYDTGYEIVQNSSTSEITISAPSAELGEIIFVTR